MEPIKHPDFQCPICGSNHYAPIMESYGRPGEHFNEALSSSKKRGPEHDPITFTRITGYECLSCSALFKNPLKFSTDRKKHSEKKDPQVVDNNCMVEPIALHAEATKS